MGATAPTRPSIDERRADLRRRFPVWQPLTLATFIERCAEEYGERPLVVGDERWLSYERVASEARRIGDGLAALGVRPGDRVGMLMANHLEFAALKFGIAAAGAVAIPFNFLYRAEELAYVLAQSRCNVLITMSGFADLRYPEMLDAIAPGWSSGAAKTLPDLRAVVVLPAGEGAAGSAAAPAGDGAAGSAQAPAGVLDVAALEQLGAANEGAAAAAGAGERPPGELADILYTSGTTGAPKGVMVSGDAVLRTAYGSALTRAFEDGRRILFSLPCYHMFGYVEGLLGAMFVGGAVIPRLQFSPADYFAAIERHRATEMLCVPTMTVALLEHPDRGTRDLSSFFALLSGAAPAPAWLWEKVQDELGVSELTTGYGMTECGGAMTMTLPEDPVDRQAGTVGRVKLAGAAGIAERDGELCEYATVDPVTGDPLPPGVEGELVSRGPTHMLGFWEKPTETAEALHDGWLHSGDLGLVDADGYLRVTGRSKELYKSGGELVMPKEIEDLLTLQAGVSQAYAVGLHDDRWGEVGCAFVVPEPGVELDVEALLGVCRARLARFKVPKVMLVIDADALPRTPTGKVQKFKLIELADGRRKGS